MLGSADSINLLKSSYSVSAKLKATAEWNHNIFNAPRIYGSFTGSTPNNLCALTDNTSSASTTSLRGATRLYYGSSNYSLNYTFPTLSPNFIENTGFKFSASVSTYYRISFYAKTASSTREKLFVHFNEYKGNSIITDTGSSVAVNVDNIDWSFNELLISAASKDVDNIHVDFSSEIVTSSYQVSDITVVQVPNFEWQSNKKFKVKDTFSGFRPGDEIAENQISQQLSKIIYQTGQTLSTKYVPGMDTLSYFAVENSGGVYSIYDNTITTNKIVLKFLNGAASDTLYGNHIGTNYSVFTYSASTNNWTEITGTTLGNINENGSLIIYWNGSTWTTTKTVGQISSDGKSILNTTTIDGLAVKVTSVTSSKLDKTIRFLEVSPRLSIDLSDYIIDFSASKELDSKDVPLPVGISTSNNSSLVLENLPRPDSGSNYFNIFSDQSNTSPLSKVLRRDVKVNVKFDLYNTAGGIVQSDLPLFVGYVDSWNINDVTSELNLFDYGKFLQNKRSRDLLLLPYPGADNTVSNILTQIFEQNSFSDYSIASSLLNYHINSFYIDKQKTIWDAIQELLFPYQYMGYFNNQGIFIVKSYEDVISSSPVFKFTDTGETGYISNINTLSINKKEKPSEIKVRYNTISTKISADETDKNLKDAVAMLRTAPDKVWEITDEQALGYTRLKHTVEATDKELFLDTTAWGKGGIQEWSDFSGYLILDKEIMKYDGIEVKYSLDGTVTTQIVKDQKEYKKIQNDIFEAQKQTGDKTLTITRTGRLVNLERGILGTKAAKHQAGANKPQYGPAGETDIASMYLYKREKKSSDFVAVSGRPSIAKTDYHGDNKDTVIRLESIAGQDQTILGYKGDDNSFDTYEFVFAYPKDKVVPHKSKSGKLIGNQPTNENDYMGVCLGVDPTNGKGIFIEFPLKSNKVNKRTAVYFNKNANPIAMSKNKMDLYKSTKKSVTQTSTTAKSSKGKSKKKNKKASSKKTKKTVYYKEINFDDNYNTIRIEMSGKKVNKVSINGITWGFKVKKKAWNGETGIDRSNGLIGIYAGKDTHIVLSSIKAWDSTNLKVDTSKLINQSAKPIDYTPSTVVRGVGVYDVELSSPSYNHKILKPAGTFSVENDAQKEMAIAIGESDTEIFQEEYSPFRTKFVAKNISDKYIPVYSSGDMLGLRISANTLVKSEEIEYSEKISNNSDTSNVIEISSDWIQTEANARKIIKRINKFVKVAMDTYNIEVFGNPLIEIGDVVNLYYHQSGMISDSKYIIIGVDEKFDGGFETSLILRKITV